MHDHGTRQPTHETTEHKRLHHLKSIFLLFQFNGPRKRNDFWSAPENVIISEIRLQKLKAIFPLKMR